MTVQMILAPVFVQVLLTFILLFWMARQRFASAKSGQPTEGARGSPRTFAWPQKAQQASDCFHNQLELPILFYVAVIIALITRKADLLFVLLSWVFVATRYVHAFEHTSANRLKVRFGAFLAGALILIGLWIELALKVLTGV